MDEADVKPNPALEELAHERFLDLSDAELKLLRAVPYSLSAHCGDPAIGQEEPVNNPKFADTWGREHDIRGDLIRWLCVEPDAQSHIDLRGIRIQSARICGELDLSFVVVPFPLIFHSCKFAKPLRLILAELYMLDLSASAAGAVYADTAQIKGSVLLCGGFSAEGAVHLDGASIGGNLDCEKGSFKGLGVALVATRAKIEGSVYLADQFSAEFGVSLYGASIGGSLHCEKGSFKGLGDVALNAERAKIGGNVYLYKEFSAEGAVSLYGASIGGNLHCEKGSFKNAKGVALRAGRAKIEGNVYLRNEFSAEGEVSLNGASIGGNLHCEKGSFKNAEGVALDTKSAKIEGNVYLRNEFSAEGEVSLNGASIGGNLECDKGKFTNLRATALNFELAKVERSVFLNEGFTAIGKVMLGDAVIAGAFNVIGANLEGAYLDLRRASAGTLRGEPTNWPNAGNLFLDGFSYGGFAEGPTDGSRGLRWLRLQISQKTDNSFRPHPYRHLAQVFREQGNEAAAREVLIGLEDDRRKHGGLTKPQWLWARILQCTMAYGYRPFRALWFIGLFVIVGYLVFGSAYRSGQLVPSDKDAYEQFKAGQPPGSYEDFCALVYSFDTFVPIIDLGQRSRWKPVATESEVFKPSRNTSNNLVCAICDPLALTHWRPSLPAWLLRFYWWLDIIAGWFFTGLFAAGISGLVQRD